MRSCAGCGERFPKRDLVRIVRTLDGTVEVDPTGKRAGRGTYLCAREECWQQSLKKSRLDYALRSSLLERDREALSAYYLEQFKPTSIGDQR